MDRRNVLKSVALAAAGAGLLASSGGDVSAGTESKQTLKEKATRMPFISAKDGTPLFYKDWGAGKPIVFVSSWGLNSDMWQYQMTPMVNQDLRCVAYDRRGHGRSAQPAHGYDYDTLADDLAAVIEQLDLRQVTLIGHSMAGGEIVRYLSRCGAGRVSRIVLVAPTTPFILKTPDNPDGVPREVFDHTRTEWAKDFPKWLADNVRPFFVADTSQAMMDWLMRLMTQTSLKAILDCNQAIVETDFRAELPKVNVPTLIIQGDKDVSAPLDLTGRKTAKLIPAAELKVYEGAPHGLMFTHIDRFNSDLIAFAQH
jgi:pimeloyl-ACP methyl ester carboxylesterase